MATTNIRIKKSIVHVHLGESLQVQSTILTLWKTKQGWGGRMPLSHDGRTCDVTCCSRRRDDVIEELSACAVRLGLRICRIEKFSC